MESPKVTFYSTPDRVKRIAEVRKATGLTGNSAVVTHALDVMVMLYECRKNGGRVILEDRQGVHKEMKLL